MRRSHIAASSLVLAAAGGFAFLHSTVDVDDAPRRLDAADLDGDGDIDLFVIADGPGDQASLQVLLNEGGDFVPGWSAVQGTSGTLPWDVDLADTNGDEVPDVLYLLPFGAPYQRFNDGAGNFDALVGVPAFAGRAEQEPGDLDGDGDTDLVYYEEDVIGYFGTLEGSDDGNFQFDLSTETWSGLGSADFARRFVLGDVTGDGLQDAALASKNGLQLIRGEPAAPGSSLPGWLDQIKLLSQPCADVVVVDLDGDARLDIVASVPASGSVVVFRSLPAGGFAPPGFFAAGPIPDAIAAADLDLDGHADVIVTNRTSGRVSVLPGTGTGSLGAPQGFRAGRQPTDIVAADFDGDGDVDLAVACAVSGNVALLVNPSL